MPSNPLRDGVRGLAAPQARVWPAPSRGIDGFGALLAHGFVEHEETPGLAPTKEGDLEFFRI